ncbi:hypothetical protein [Tardiphaga sp.]|uniref:hypothetical protein n=1 Tax=Tardiphaga sp. TaxID=1926292 RepID=UPI00352B8B66
MTVSNVTFLSEPVMPLNPGLVGIIGARGSGKTALSDFIALGASAFSLHSNRLSFIERAREHLAGTRVDLGWGDATGSGSQIGRHRESAMECRLVNERNPVTLN